MVDLTEENESEYESESEEEKVDISRMDKNEDISFSNKKLIRPGIPKNIQHNRMFFLKPVKELMDSEEEKSEESPRQEVIPLGNYQGPDPLKQSILDKHGLLDFGDEETRTQEQENARTEYLYACHFRSPVPLIT